MFILYAKLVHIEIYFEKNTFDVSTHDPNLTGYLDSDYRSTIDEKLLTGG